MTTRATSSRGFTLVETLISIMLLGLGLIMVATVFAVAGNWARQSNEETIGQMVGQTAVTAIQTRFKSSDLTAASTAVAPLSFTTTQLPWRSRSFNADTSTPWPVSSSMTIPPVYTWTALIRRQPGQIPGNDNRFDVVVFVVRKGQIDQTFGTDTAALGRLNTDPKDANNRYYMPSLIRTTWGSLPNGVRAVGQGSGNVYRKLATSSDPGEDVWYVPACDGTDPANSPVVYVYQSTIAF